MFTFFYNLGIITIVDAIGFVLSWEGKIEIGFVNIAGKGQGIRGIGEIKVGVR